MTGLVHELFRSTPRHPPSPRLFAEVALYSSCGLVLGLRAEFGSETTEACLPLSPLATLLPLRALSCQVDGSSGISQLLSLLLSVLHMPGATVVRHCSGAGQEPGCPVVPYSPRTPDGTGVATSNDDEAADCRT
ncbi:hypothetical protein N657DRAFT_148779 [Parathielavia appendiculata]|uniref:Uncharacterized protein n=1 Tax=Parathielavia appendiculata TaxID=2587402 RepID=A0AAN6TUA7_9PEZI|nr:hypothetical protein N657DRAFT_148779 [Parathielavia appendiculata]